MIALVERYDIFCRFWDPILGRLGGEHRGNLVPLAENEARAMLADLWPAVTKDYRGQGAALLSVEMRRVGRR